MAEKVLFPEESELDWIIYLCVDGEWREKVERNKEDLALQNPSRYLWPQGPAKHSSSEKKR